MTGATHKRRSAEQCIRSMACRSGHSEAGRPGSSHIRQVCALAWGVGLLLSLLPVPLVQAEEPNPHIWKPQTKSVAVFKSGFGFFMRSGEVTLRDGWCLAGQVPPASFGTLAIYSQKENEVVDVVGAGPGEMVEFDDIDARKDPADKLARLQAAVGLRVALGYTHRGTTASATGKLVAAGEQFAIVEEQAQTFAVPTEAVTSMRVLALPIRVHVSSGEAGTSASTELGMAYLRQGITWIPEYTLRILDDTTAELTLRGTVVNEAEDLIHCDVHFVVGMPQFLHADYLSPIAIGQAIRTIGTAVAQRGMPREMANQIMSQALLTTNTAPAPSAAAPEALELPPGDLNSVLAGLPRIDGPGGADLTVYTKTDLTIRRGEKAIVTLFTRKIHYGHLYRWQPPQRMQHLLTLGNDTDTAWTTGPCMAIGGHQPLGEDLLKYTPKGGTCEIPITAAISIAHEKTESEADRKLKAHEPQHNRFLDLVTLHGELKLRNFGTEAANVVIVTPIPGKPLSASHQGILSSDPEKLQLLERGGTVHWRVTIEPGQSQTLTYTYERYVPSI